MPECGPVAMPTRRTGGRRITLIGCDIAEDQLTEPNYNRAIDRRISDGFRAKATGRVHDRACDGALRTSRSSRHAHGGECQPRRALSCIAHGLANRPRIRGARRRGARTIRGGGSAGASRPGSMHGSGFAGLARRVGARPTPGSNLCEVDAGTSTYRPQQRPGDGCRLRPQVG
jgi:hypothetical protein